MTGIWLNLHTRRFSDAVGTTTKHQPRPIAGPRTRAGRHCGTAREARSSLGGSPAGTEHLTPEGAAAAATKGGSGRGDLPKVDRSHGGRRGEREESIDIKAKGKARQGKARQGKAKMSDSFLVFLTGLLAAALATQNCCVLRLLPSEADVVVHVQELEHLDAHKSRRLLHERAVRLGGVLVGGAWALARLWPLRSIPCNTHRTAILRTVATPSSRQHHTDSPCALLVLP